MSEDRVVIRARPTPEGRVLGEQLARLTEVEMVKLRAKFPGHLEPCGTCAFRRGTVPNGCPTTLMDAIKCAVEGDTFYCHEHRKGEPMQACTGWLIAYTAMRSKPDVLKRMGNLTAPWEYTREPTPEELARTTPEESRNP